MNADSIDIDRWLSRCQPRHLQTLIRSLTVAAHTAEAMRRTLEQVHSEENAQRIIIQRREIKTHLARVVDLLKGTPRTEERST